MCVCVCLYIVILTCIFIYIYIFTVHMKFPPKRKGPNHWSWFLWRYTVSNPLKKTIVKSDLAKVVFVRCPLVNIDKDLDNSTCVDHF